MSTHTPGPWTYRRHTNEREFIIETQPHGEDVALIYNATVQDAANARLIAAAPRMETFLRALDRLWTLQAGQYASLDTDRAELRDILSIIDGTPTKAEG